MTVTIPVGRLHPSHRARAERVRREAETLARWARFRQRYEEACETTAHGDRLALRLRIAAEFGMEDREAQRALHGG